MDVWAKLDELRRSGSAVVVVTVADARGSVPGETGAKALVTPDGLQAGTLGGGRVEARAIDEAMAMFDDHGDGCRLRKWNLQRDVGMTCGGEMTFLFERVEAANRWHIVIFGAGHVSRALVRILATLDCRVDVIDPREDWLSKIPDHPNVTRHAPAAYQDLAGLVAPDSHLLALTMGHATDRPVLRDVLRVRPELPFVGVIGSASKRAVLTGDLRGDGLPEEVLEKIECPVGLPIGGNAPAEIAVSIAARLLQVRG